MKTNEFTSEQLSRIYRLVEKLHKINNDLASDRKVEGIAYYINKRRTFICSYVELSYTNAMFDSQYKCVMIEPDGTEIDGLEYFENEAMCSKYIQKCEKIELEK